MDSARQRLVRGWLGCALAVLLSFGGQARAAEPVSPEAKRHVDLGVAAYEAGRYADASKEFELAYRLSHKPALLFNIAQAEAKLGHEEAAIAFLRRYLEERPDAPDAPAVRAEVEALERAVAVGKDKQRVEAEAAAARTKANEAEARHDAEAAEQRKRNAEAEAARAAQDRQAELTRPVEHRPSSAPTVRFTGIALLVAGPALVAVGIGLGVLALQTADEVSNKRGVEYSDVGALESRGRAAANAGIALDVIGGVAAVAGAALLGYSYKVKAQERRVWLQPGGRGLGVGGTF